jgi:hypothetical protein
MSRSALTRCLHLFAVSSPPGMCQATRRSSAVTVPLVLGDPLGGQSDRVSIVEQRAVVADAAVAVGDSGSRQLYPYVRVGLTRMDH